MQHDIKKVKEDLTEAQIEERRVAAEAFRDLIQRGFKLRDDWRCGRTLLAASDAEHPATTAATAAAAEDKTSNNADSTSTTLTDYINEVAPLLERNPDCYSIFAFRRELFEALKKEKMTPPPTPPTNPQTAAAAAAVEEEKNQKEEGANENENENEPKQPTPPPSPSPEELFIAFSKDVLVPELKFNTVIVKKDYKSYAAWVHRKWVLNQMHPKVRIGVLKVEHEKIDQLLAQDERNFHAWGYRRWVTGELKQAGMYSDEGELAFAISKIGNNFSNYSAWHNRALVLWKRIASLEEKLAQEENANAAAAAVEELAKQVCDQVKDDQKMLVQAFYCDPHDQSAFVYCKNLVERVDACASSSKKKLEKNVPTNVKEANADLQKAVLDACVELAEEEKKCVWPRYMRLCLPLHPIADKGTAVAAWKECAALDPMRREYYAFETAKIA